ncbi:MAG: FMN-binding protein [Candidatus Syntrophosphaera sp.]|nr:FMN-binding protein [Candidatus Syntrophosphaera sp.]
MAEQGFMERPVYPVLFIIALSLVFVGILAAMYRMNEPGIEKQKLEAYEKSILSLCADSLASATGISTPEIMAAYPQSFADYIKPLPEGAYPRRAFEVKFGDRILAYVFDITGKGLWGTMRALIATTPAKDTIIGINVYEQLETPGLGARIEESWFTGQFEQKTVLDNGVPVDFELIPEGQSAAEPNQIRQVTGATITSKAVLTMLQNELRLILDVEAGK